MATAGDVIKTAFRKITLLGANADLEADDGQTGIEYLNDLMAELDVQEIDLGYTIVESLADDITLPAGAIGPIKSLLALKLWDEYAEGETPQPTLIAQAQGGMKILELLGVGISATEFPSTLPIGSGNEGSGVYTDHFYSDLEDTILAETTGSIALEDGT